VSVTDPIPPPPSNSSRTKIIAVIVVLAAFGCGIVAGAVGDRLWLFHHGPAHGAGRFIAERILKRLDRELHLTPQQHDQVKKILEAHRVRVEGVFEAVKPQVHHEIDAANNEIRAVLTPEQRQKYEELRMRLHPHRGEF